MHVLLILQRLLAAWQQGRGGASIGAYLPPATAQDVLEINENEQFSGG